MEFLKFFLFALLIGTLTGCSLRFEEVTDNPNFAYLRGKQFISLTPMYLYSVDLPPGYNGQVDKFFLFPFLDGGGIYGREIINRRILSEGFVIEVESIYRSINHLPGFKKVEAKVRFLYPQQESSIPVFIDLDKYLLNQDFFTNFSTLEKAKDDMVGEAKR